MRYKALIKFFVTQLEGIRKSQRKTLAAIVFALMTCNRVGVAAIGRAIPGDARKKHCIKRVDRFLGNERIRLDEALKPLVAWIIGPRKEIFVAVDWSDLHDSHQVLKAVIIAKGRGLPILWKVVAKSSLTLNQNRIEDKFLESLRHLIPEDIRVIILADRGFKRVSFLQKLDSLGFGYVVRTQTNVGVKGEGFQGTLGDLTVRPGTLRDLGWVSYQDKTGHPVRVVINFSPGQKEPWLLATNLKRQPAHIVSFYGRRWEIETCLKDLKNEHYGFLLRGLRLKDPHRWERMLLIFAYAYFLLVSIGAWGEAKGLHRSFMANTSRERTISLWRVGRLLLFTFRCRLEKLVALAPSLAYAMSG